MKATAFSSPTSACPVRELGKIRSAAFLSSRTARRFRAAEKPPRLRQVIRRHRLRDRFLTADGERVQDVNLKQNKIFYDLSQTTYSLLPWLRHSTGKAPFPWRRLALGPQHQFYLRFHVGRWWRFFQNLCGHGGRWDFRRREGRA
ncbi:ribosome-binding factor A [Striga asiatica]|uniref:Ribosome-binding factor A n=1 Tax=Striga asiatica TaxID=4170 RepID=A0A5A7Q6C0_STRAF|nr:ribosome-binding factor A [Striga asiatica]